MKAPLPMMRATILAVAIALTIPLPHLAFAQAVSDADRQAARDLFTAGFQLQQAGKYAEALDRFQRAQAVFSAPTNLLHIAECEAQLGKLVEASETYRGLARLALPKDAPPSFIAAQQQGAAELQQVEARIPKVRVDVLPANVPNVSITIDEQPMNVALVGVERPIDPGPHKITAFAPGYGQKEATIVIKEKDPTKQVTLSLQQTGVVVYTPVPGTTPNGTMTLPSPPSSSPQPSSGGPPPSTPPPPPSFAERPKPPTAGLLAGVRLGPDFVTGGLTEGFAMKDAFGTGFALGFQGGLRFARRLYVGGIYEHVFYGQGSGVGNIAASYGATPGAGGATPNITTFGNLVALDLSYISNPEGVGVTVDGAVAYRSAGFSANDGSISATYSGLEALLGLGIWIRAGQSVVIIPRIDAGIGSFSNQSVQCGSGCTAGTTGSSISSAQGHVVFFFGVGGYFNLDFGKKS